MAKKAYVWDGSTWIEISSTIPSISSIVPSQTGNSGKFLTTDGSSVSWGTVDLTPYATKASPTFTGTPVAPTAAVDTNTTQIATTAYVIGQASSSNPSSLGSVAIGTSTRYARSDHIHPTTGLGLTSNKLSQFSSTTSAELAGVISDETGTGSLVFSNSPTFTGTVSVPTPTTNSSATTKSYVDTQINNLINPFLLMGA